MAFRLPLQYQYCQRPVFDTIEANEGKGSRMKIRLKARELAEEKGFNQSSLSRKANVDFKTIQRLFRDPYRDISVSTLVKIARALKVDMHDLVEVTVEEDD